MTEINDIHEVIVTIDRCGYAPAITVTRWCRRSCNPYAYTLYPIEWTYDDAALLQQYEAVMIEQNIRRWLARFAE